MYCDQRSQYIAKFKKGYVVSAGTIRGNTVFQGTHLYFRIKNTKTHKNLIIEAKPLNKVTNKRESTTRGRTNPKDQ